MRALVTGGAGFIGSHLCDELLKAGADVICLDNLITGSEENIAHNLGNSSFKFIKHDVCRPVNIEEKLDYVLHLASPASPKDYLKYPIETMNANSVGTLNMLELARKKGASFLLASTSEIYGDPLVSPQTEEYLGNVSCTGPRSVYDEAKRFAEALTSSYVREFSLDAKIARFFNTYGPRMRKNDGRAIPNFIWQAMKNDPLTVYGNGSQTRSFCYISDLVNGLIKLMKIKVDSPVNLGNPCEISILELARIVNRLFNKNENNVSYQPLPQDDPKQRRPEISKAKALLDWEPKIGFDEGIKNTVEWFRRVYG